MKFYRQLGMELTIRDYTSTDNLLYVASAIPLSHVTGCGSTCLSSFGLELLYSGLSPSPDLGLDPNLDRFSLPIATVSVAIGVLVVLANL